MKKTFRKAMLSTMAMLLVGVMSLTGVTYAWFTSNNEAKVNQFTVNVAGGATGSLMISTDTNNLLSFSGATSYAVPEKSSLIPVSLAVPTTTETYNKPAFYTGEIVSDTEIKSAELTAQKTGNEENGYKYGYYTFNLYFKNEGTSAIDVVLDSSKTTFLTNTADMSAEGATATYEAKSAALAARIGFVTTNSTPFKGNALSTYTGKLTYNAAKIYEPNAGDHLEYGVIDQNIITGGKVVAGSDPETKEDYVKSDVFPYKAISGATSTPFHRYNDTANLTAVTTTKMDTDTLVTVDAGSIVKVTVYIWLEGQDVDCINEISAKDIQCNLGFAIKQTAAAS